MARVFCISFKSALNLKKIANVRVSYIPKFRSQPNKKKKTSYANALHNDTEKPHINLYEKDDEHENNKAKQNREKKKK